MSDEFALVDLARFTCWGVIVVFLVWVVIAMIGTNCGNIRRSAELHKRNQEKIAREVRGNSVDR